MHANFYYPIRFHHKCEQVNRKTFKINLINGLNANFFYQTKCFMVTNLLDCLSD